MKLTGIAPPIRDAGGSQPPASLFPLTLKAYFLDSDVQGRGFSDNFITKICPISITFYDAIDGDQTMKWDRILYVINYH